jgi:type I restriction enzyme S subunit
MSFPRYPAYKDSGVEWLGELPEHWDILPLKRNAHLLTEKTDSRSNPVALENIEGWTGKLIETETEFQGEGVAFEVGDLLFGKLKPYLAKVYLASKQGEAVGDFHVIRPGTSLFSRFLQYQLLTTETIDLVNGSTYGAKMPRASWAFLGSLPIPVPPTKEQPLIATFLDRETAKIDALIAEQQRLIELLQKKRQSVISQSVTKGLNPDAPMKDSGVEWLGEVPEHWRVVPLKNLVESGTSISYGIVQPGEPLEDGIPFVQTTNMTKGEFSLEALQKTSVHIASAYPRSELTGGEVLLGIRASIGAAHVAPIWLNGANLSRGVARIAPGPEIKNDFLVCYLRSEATMRYWLLAKQGSTFNEISIETVKNLRVCVPESEEQREIADYIRYSEDRYEDALTQSSSLISLLQERRSALISAAVTGQIDVRGLVSQGDPA